MKRRDMVICTASLATDEGVTADALELARHFGAEAIGPLLAHTPLDKHQVMIERILSGIVGISCGHIGPEATKQVLDALRLALEAAAAERAKAHAH